jgi:hypothetical protein
MIFTLYILVWGASLACSTNPYVFADLKLDNVLFDHPYSDADIDALLLNEPLAVDGEFELHGKQYPILRSQPLTHKFPWDASRHLTEVLNVYLTDFSHGLFYFPALWPVCCTFFSQHSKSMRHTGHWKSAHMGFVHRRLF